VVEEVEEMVLMEDQRVLQVEVEVVQYRILAGAVNTGGGGGGRRCW
jgi:hypothetical protein